MLHKLLGKLLSKKPHTFVGSVVPKKLLSDSSYKGGRSVREIDLRYFRPVLDDVSSVLSETFSHEFGAPLCQAQPDRFVATFEGAGVRAQYLVGRHPDSTHHLPASHYGPARTTSDEVRCRLRVSSPTLTLDSIGYLIDNLLVTHYLEHKSDASQRLWTDHGVDRTKLVTPGPRIWFRGDVHLKGEELMTALGRDARVVATIVRNHGDLGVYRLFDRDTKQLYAPPEIVEQPLQLSQYAGMQTSFQHLLRKA